MKKVLLILIPLIIVGGGSFVGLAMAGRVKVPGLTPKHLMGTAKKVEEEQKEPPPKVETKKVTPKPTSNPEAGVSAIAALWEGLDSEKLAEITKPWKVNELALVLMKMEPKKVSNLLAEVDPKRASEISKEIQRLAAEVKS